ncbi:chaperonin GroEL [Rickettsiales endosymbiont of Peranema trichophorum]|uniref:chaperonin GroEL n=1 Tax=Rickettsiales endosymbiont of Peranema trichophorum TaxID=2486577 RepID=UPI001022C7B8|nr:chaperonin GroEL [Rickettsiales endosymbiont of Peranema trichophorum]RZI47532.1 chaperonin GroEL [Rickettsiales endosymbiont of Peranema trichophorum]
MSNVKIILKGAAARDKISKGVEVAADTVGATLGPRGRNVVIEKSFGAPKITKDGVTVAKEIKLADHFENMGAQLVIEAASKANDNAGDGTTTTAVIARAITMEGNKAVTAGMNPMDLRRGIEIATHAVVDEIRKQSKSIKSSDEIAQVATISANGDADIGKKLAEAFQKVGKDGVVTVEEANKSDDFEVEIVEGMNFDRGYLSPYFVTNPEKMVCEFEKPYILLVEKKIGNLQQLLPVLEKVVQTGRPLLIIAEDVEGEALATLIVNKLRGGLKVAAVKAPGFGDRRKAMMEDISIVTGGDIVSEDLGHKLENTSLDSLGTAKKVILTKDDTTIIDGAGDKSAIESRCNQIKAQIKETTSDYDREKLEERLAKLAGGVAILKVGGITEVEVKEKKERVEDAYHATKAAIAEGIVPGGGCTLLYASLVLDKLKGKNEDEQAGINIIKKALTAPVRKIVENSGMDGALVVSKLLEQTDHNRIFDAQTHQYVDAFKAGIVDPTKIVRTALQSAASVAGLVITTEAIITNKPEDEKSGHNHPGMGGGMGGMGGGMDF